MDYKILESNFESEETLEKVLDYLEKPIKKVKYWAEICQKGIMHNSPEDINQALTELAGAYSDLRVALGIAEYQKKNRELKKYMDIKIETENNDKKFVDGASKQEASEFVGKYRRIRNIIEAYKESAQTSITTLQNINNNLDKELRRNPEE